MGACDSLCMCWTTASACACEFDPLAGIRDPTSAPNEYQFLCTCAAARMCTRVFVKSSAPRRSTPDGAGGGQRVRPTSAPIRSGVAGRRRHRSARGLEPHRGLPGVARPRGPEDRHHPVDPFLTTFRGRRGGAGRQTAGEKLMQRPPLLSLSTPRPEKTAACCWLSWPGEKP